MARSIVPPYLLARLATADAERFPAATAAARRTLRMDAPRKAARLTLSVDGDSLVAELSDAPDREVSDAGGREVLPGRVVRREGQEPSGDVAADEAYDGLGATFDLFSEVFGRNSIDDAGLPLRATVHYGRLYDNAFWDGERMVFGDGDGEVFQRFTRSLSVIGHELAHGVTQFSSGLEYHDQPGALNESISDVFGALVEQYARRQTTAEASWLVGEGLFTPAVEGRALRSMREPGTAYDDDVLGKDPQPAHLDDYITTRDDDGGVHLNSGIPNRAFVLAADALGGHAWERAGVIWYDTLTGGLNPAVDFAGFAAATARAAAARYGEVSAEVDAVRAGWDGVGVTIDGGRA
ncbi:M4 family metallopeptidase [Protaetiibacter intestinalis]|uniref:Neutral metalloproteinase n=1 Tax=Protaetiibacter intestinalis TaxID=2419774 RepID=A0A387B659_9MICO|nr:M4 family metallopeptidase [Protaetiibacter intestinalis]AYF99234.1 peptidase M4 family protein [Protaetiibacter intestinalis]